MKPLHILVVGAGALGTIFADAFARSGHLVTLVVRDRSERALRSAGALRVDTDSASWGTPLGPCLRVCSVTAAAPQNFEPVDFALFATKANQLDQAIFAVRSHFDMTTALASGVQNGVWKEDALKSAFGARATPLATFVGGESHAPGHAVLSARGVTYLAPAHARVSDLIEGLAEHDLPCIVREDVDDVVWTKAANGVGIFALSTLTRLSTRQIRSSPALMEAYFDLITESAAVARSAGRTMVDLPGLPLASALNAFTRDEAVAILTLPRAASDQGPKSSMLQDLLRGRPLEHHQVFGDIVERAARLNVAVPHTTLVATLVEALAYSKETET